MDNFAGSGYTYIEHANHICYYEVLISCLYAFVAYKLDDIAFSIAGGSSNLVIWVTFISSQVSLTQAHLKLYLTGSMLKNLDSFIK